MAKARGLCGVLLVLVALAVGGAPAVGAPGDETDGSTTLNWRQLGMGSTVSFDAVNVPQTVVIPVPDGTRPTVLTGQLQPAVNVTNGFLEVDTADGQILGAVPVPAANAALRATPFSVDISGVQVENHVAVIRLMLRQTVVDAICGPVPQLTLGNLAVTFTGNQVQPTTVQQFLPPLLPNAVVYVDPTPTAAEKQAVLRLVAALTNHYRPIPIDISIRELSRNSESPRAAFDTLSRSIVIRESATSGVVVESPSGAPYLAITGENDALTDQVELFSAGLQSIAQVGAVAVESVGESTVQGSNTVTFEQFSPNLRVSVLGQATLNTGFDPAMFGLSRPGTVDVDLRAIYTPVQDTEKATVLAQSGGQTLYSAPLDESGKLHAEFTIPAERVASSADLTLLVSYEPAPGACRPQAVPMTFEIEPNSTATAQSHDVGVGGFSALPLAWAPTFQVATDDSDPSTLAYAADMVAAAQALSPELLRPIVVDLDEAAGSGSGALIVATAESLAAAGVQPPIDAAGETTTVDLPAQVVAQIPSGLGSIQSFAQNDRTLVVVTTSGSWMLVDPLFDYLDTLDQGLRDVSGDVLVAGQGGVPTVLTIYGDGLPVSGADVGDGWHMWLWIGVALAACVSVVAIVMGLLRRRSGTAGPSAADHDS